MRSRIAAAYVAEGRDPDSVPLGVQRFMCVTASRAETLDYVDNARHQMRLASALRRRAEVTDGAMMREIPIPNGIPLEEMARNLLVGDCGRSSAPVRRDRAARQTTVLFQVGGS